jgi:hypothetical protein
MKSKQLKLSITKRAGWLAELVSYELHTAVKKSQWNILFVDFKFTEFSMNICQNSWKQQLNYSYYFLIF